MDVPDDRVPTVHADVIAGQITDDGVNDHATGDREMKCLRHSRLGQVDTRDQASGCREEYSVSALAFSQAENLSHRKDGFVLSQEPVGFGAVDVVVNTE